MSHRFSHSWPRQRVGSSVDSESWLDPKGDEKRSELPRPARADALAEGGGWAGLPASTTVSDVSDSPPDTGVSTASAVSTPQALLRSVPLLLLLVFVSVLEGTSPSDSARFVSRSNATRVRRLRKQRVGLSRPTSESQPTGQNARLERSFGVQWETVVACTCGSATDRATQLMTALYCIPPLPHPTLLRSSSAGADCGTR